MPEAPRSGGSRRRPSLTAPSIVTPEFSLSDLIRLRLLRRSAVDERWLVHSAEATTTGELPDSNYRFMPQSDRDQRPKVTVISAPK
jgi:hypothetical protein